MSKKINIKPTIELREMDKRIDAWVNQAKPLSEPAQPSNKDIESYRFTIDIPKILHKRIKKTCAVEDTTMKDKLMEILLENFPET